MNKNDNKVTVVGLISEIDINEREKDGRNYVMGNIKVEVEPDNIVQVNMFSFATTKTGKINPAYEQIMNVANKGISLAAVGGDRSKASKIRCTSARLEESQFASRNSNAVVSATRISGSFFSTSNVNEDYKAVFQCGIYITDIHEEVNREGEPTGRLIVKGAVEQYNRYDVITFVAEFKQAIEYIQSHWEVGNFVFINGRIASRSYTYTVNRGSDLAFGESTIESYTNYRTEYIITSGSAPQDEDDINVEAFTEGLKARQLRMNELTATPKVVKNDDFGF